MNLINKHLDKNNLHHAYLIEGAGEEIVPEIQIFIETLGVEAMGNADVSHINLDSFKVEDARNLKSYASERGYSSAKKIFIVSANNFLLEAQNSLLKLFEEPIENTHFFVVTPDVNSLLKTLVSRFYFISAKPEGSEDMKDAEKFIAMPVKNRIDFIKELLVKTEDEEDVETPTLDSTRSKALRFLNALELVLHEKFMAKTVFDTKNNNSDFFHHFFKVREFLRMPGSSPKTLMESVALVVPNF